MPLSKQKSLSGLFITYSLMELLLCDSPRRSMTFFHLTSCSALFDSDFLLLNLFSVKITLENLFPRFRSSAKVILIPFVKTVEVKGRINLSRKKLLAAPSAPLSFLLSLA